MMTLKEKCPQRVTINGSTLFCTGTTLVAMGLVALAAGLVLQKQLLHSKCEESGNCFYQWQNVKAGIWCGIPIVFYGIFTVLVGICRNKAMVMMLALLSILSALFGLTLLVISEVNIVSSLHQNMSTVDLRFTASKGSWSELFNGRLAGMNTEPRETTARNGDFFLRFSPSDETIQLERSILKGDRGTRVEQKSATMNNKNGQNGKRRVGIWPENAEKLGRDLDLYRDLWNRWFRGGDSLDSEEILRSSAKASSNDGARTPATMTTREADDSSYEGSGFAEGFDDDEEDVRTAEEKREKDEYDSYSELEGGEGNKTTEELYIYFFEASYEDDSSAARKRRELNQDSPELGEGIISPQRFIQLMSFLMAVAGIIAFVLSIVTATLAFASFCCYQKDEKLNARTTSERQSDATPTAAAGKDEDDVALLSGDANLLEV